MRIYNIYTSASLRAPQSTAPDNRPARLRIWTAVVENNNAQCTIKQYYNIYI